MDGATVLILLNDSKLVNHVFEMTGIAYHASEYPADPRSTHAEGRNAHIEFNCVSHKAQLSVTVPAIQAERIFPGQYRGDYNTEMVKNLVGKMKTTEFWKSVVLAMDHAEQELKERTRKDLLAQIQPRPSHPVSEDEEVINLGIRVRVNKQFSDALKAIPPLSYGEILDFAFPLIAFTWIQLIEAGLTNEEASLLIRQKSQQEIFEFLKQNR